MDGFYNMYLEETKKAEEFKLLLKSCLEAINTIENQPLNNKEYPTTYRLASKIDKILKEN